MMKALLTVIVLTSSFCIHAQSIKQLKWLSGTWERQSPKQGQSAFESWGITKNELSGLGVSMKGTDTVFMEKLSIIKKDQDLYYVANVSQNAAPTFFKITSISKRGFVSENLQHDFPKKIEYLLEGEMLTATISGGGKEIPFVFTKK